MTTPTLRQLEIFAQAVASGSIAECARALGVPPAMVEDDLHALEGRLGHRLFIADDFGLQLTDAGHKTLNAMALLSGVEPSQPEDTPQPAAEHPETQEPEIVDTIPVADDPVPEPEGLPEAMADEYEEPPLEAPATGFADEIRPPVPEAEPDFQDTAWDADPDDIPSQVYDLEAPAPEPEALQAAIVEQSDDPPSETINPAPEVIEPEVIQEVAETVPDAPAAEQLAEPFLTEPDAWPQPDEPVSAMPLPARDNMPVPVAPAIPVQAEPEIVAGAPEPEPERDAPSVPEEPVSAEEPASRHEPVLPDEPVSNVVRIAPAWWKLGRPSSGPTASRTAMPESALDFDEEPLELTELAPVAEDAGKTGTADADVAFALDDGIDVMPVMELTEVARDIEPVIDDPVPQPVATLPRALAARVAFAAQAPATFPQPTVVSLFIQVPLPVPANDPEPFIPAGPPPVLELANTIQQQVTVAAHPSVFGHFQDALTAFEQANPDVAIALELDAFTAMRAEPMLASGQVDIVYYYAMGERERFESRYVWSESLSIFIGAGHPLAQKESVTVEDLLYVRPVLLGSRNALRPILDNAMIRGGIDLWQPALETDNLFNIFSAVRDGAGYFAAFGPLARDFGKMAGIKRLPLADPLPPVEVRQAVREDVRDDPVVSSLAEYLFR